MARRPGSDERRRVRFGSCSRGAGNMVIIHILPLGVFELFLDRGYKIHLTTPPIIGNTTNNGIKCIQCMINSQYQRNEKKTGNCIIDRK